MKTHSTISQDQRLNKAFTYPRTMLEAARIAKVERANVCWYIHDCREAGTIFELGKGLCSITGARARRYTNNPNTWQKFAVQTRPVWERLEDSDVVKVWEAIKAYFLAHYDSNEVHPAAEVAEIWSKEIKPIIDKEVEL